VGLKAAGHLLLGLLLGATAWIAVSAAPQRPPAPGAETTHWLAAHSLAIDHDELYVDADAARFRAAFGEAPRGVRSEPKSDRLEAPYLATRLWSWALAFGGERGPFLFHFLAFALAAFAASRALRAALGVAAPIWMALFLFGSVAFTDDAWPFAPFRMFSVAVRPNGSVVKVDPSFVTSSRSRAKP